jgi:hypothetical protein
METTGWKQGARKQASIGRVKIRYGGSPADLNATVLRLRVERLLSAVDLNPPGMAAGAVFIVRELESPTAVALSAMTQPAQAAWSERLRDEVASLYRSAARPALGAYSPGASSVLFADPGEMLTCLTRELLTGEAWHHWYWQQVLRNVPHSTSTALVTLWSGQAPFVPTAIVSLHAAEACSAIAQLSALEVRQVIRALESSFDLPTVVIPMLENGVPRSATHSGAARDTQSTRERLRTASSPGMSVAPPWQRWLPAAAGLDLLPEARYLLGLCLALYHAPAYARSTRFAGQAQSWLRAEHRAQMPGRNPSHQVTAMHSARGENSLLQAERKNLQDPQAKAEGNGSVRAKPQSSTGEEQTLAPGTINEAKQAALPQKGAFSATEGEHVGNDVPMSTAVMAEAMKQVPALSSLPLSQAEAIPSNDTAEEASSSPILTYDAIQQEPVSNEFTFGVSRPLPANGVSTRLGGIFYLINLLTWLNLPHSWHEDGRLAEQLGGWGIIEALARALLGNAHDGYVDDPIWGMLALLDQREPGTPVAARGEGIKEDGAPFRLPAAWLQRFGSSRWATAVVGERLFLFDEAAGFLIADVPLLGRSPEETVATEVEAYSVHGIDVAGQFTAHRNGSASPTFSLTLINAGVKVWIDEDVKWWLERVMGFVRYVLAHALGEPLDDTGRLVELLLNKYGQLEISRTHVDLFMSMEEINLPVRRAGLDCDPRWMPDLARIVYFHFD